MALDLSMLDAAPPSPSARGLAPTAPLDAFDEDPASPRSEEEDAGEFAALVAEVRAYGMLQPLVVRRMPAGRLLIRFGLRRYRAARCAGLAAVPYVETEDERQFDDYAQVAANAHHKPLQPMELARFIARKLAQGERKKAVAARLQLDPSAVTHLLVLADDPPPLLLELYHSRRCRSPQYLYELGKLYRRQPQLVERGLAEVREIDRLALDGLRTLLATAMPAVGEAASTAGGVPTAGDHHAAPQAVVKPDAIRRPALFACYQGSEVLLVLRRRPSAPGRIWARCEGEDVELPFDELRLARLEDLADACAAAAAVDKPARDTDDSVDGEKR